MFLAFGEQRGQHHRPGGLSCTFSPLSPLIDVWVQAHQGDTWDMACSQH